MTTRREFLTARSLREALDAVADQADKGACVPLAGNTIRLGKTAMASSFEVILNPGSGELLAAASTALELVDQLEDQMSVYRPQSELSRLNARAADGPVPVERALFELLRQAVRYAGELEGAFDPTAGPLVALWRRCRHERRVPTDAEIIDACARRGFGEVEFDDSAGTIRFRRRGIELNLNAIGKGYALDRAGEILEAGVQLPEAGDSFAPTGDSSWLMHGGHSSILARGSLAGASGWPIAIRHPLFPNRELATILLKDRGMSTSGSAVQFFRVGDRRYGHLLDPRTGWPAEGILSVTVLAPTAALAEALSTAFFVAGVEKAREYCHNYPDVTALIVPAPCRGSRVELINFGIPATDLIRETGAEPPSGSAKLSQIPPAVS
jgi:thiamine biosynthesis lipoprotein